MATKTLKARGPWFEFTDVLRFLEPFNTSGSLRGERRKPYDGTWRNNGIWSGFGRLDSKWHDSVQAADYVVWSYGTPIAWHLPGAAANMFGLTVDWVVPADGYSATTSRHQNMIRTAISAVSVFTEG